MTGLHRTFSLFSVFCPLGFWCRTWFLMAMASQGPPSSYSPCKLPHSETPHVELYIHAIWRTPYGWAHASKSWSRMYIDWLIDGMHNMHRDYRCQSYHPAWMVTLMSRGMTPPKSEITRFPPRTHPYVWLISRSYIGLVEASSRSCSGCLATTSRIIGMGLTEDAWKYKLTEPPIYSGWCQHAWSVYKSSEPS